MTERDPEVLSEDQAARVWKRAAQLQAEADGPGDAAQIESVDDGLPTPGYALAHVRAAAEEAGIAPEFVESALVALRIEQIMPAETRGRKLARRLLNNPPDVLTIQRTIEATPEEVFAAMKSAVPAAPYQMVLIDEQGDPLDGGVLVFDFPAMASPFERGFAFDVAEAGLKQAVIALRPVEGEPSQCEIVLHTAATAQKLGGTLTVVAATLFGAIGAIPVGIVALTLGGPVVGIAAGLTGLTIGASLGVKGFRALYAFALRRARKSLDGMVGAVAARTKGVWGS